MFALIAHNQNLASYSDDLTLTVCSLICYDDTASKTRNSYEIIVKKRKCKIKMLVSGDLTPKTPLSWIKQFACKCSCQAGFHTLEGVASSKYVRSKKKHFLLIFCKRWYARTSLYFLPHRTNYTLFEISTRGTWGYELFKPCLVCIIYSASSNYERRQR